jgi:hypothetical protein
MYVCFLVKNKTPIEAKIRLDKHYSDSAPEKSAIEKWFGKIKRGSRRPKEAVTV